MLGPNKGPISSSDSPMARASITLSDKSSTSSWTVFSSFSAQAWLIPPYSDFKAFNGSMDNLFCLQMRRYTWIFRFDTIFLNLRNICLGRGHLTADYLKNLMVELFHITLPIITASCKKQKKIVINKEEQDLQPSWLIAFSQLPWAFGSLPALLLLSPSPYLPKTIWYANLPTPLDELTWKTHCHRLWWSWIALSASWAPLRQSLTIANQWKGRQFGYSKC